MKKPYAPACDRNKGPILSILKELIRRDRQNLLEMGAGTGQHAVHFAPHFKHLTWIVSDTLDKHEGIKLWLKHAKEQGGVENIKGPIELEIGKNAFPNFSIDFIYASNLLHIISWELNQLFFSMLGQNLREGVKVLFYGPFNYGGEFTSKSNAEFDCWLKERDPKSGIRDIEKVEEELLKGGFYLSEDYEMPANNRLLLFKK